MKISDSPVEDLKQALRYSMIKIGLRAQNFPTDEEKALLIAHIYEHYGNHTPEEVKMAFDMAITGKLNIDEKEVKSYENFSCLYFSGIMNAYRKWAAETSYQIEREDREFRLIQESKTKEITEEDYLELYEAVKSDLSLGRISFLLIPEMLYDWMERKGMINLSVQEKKLYFDKAIKEKGDQLRNRALEDPVSAIYRQALHTFEREREGLGFLTKTKHDLVTLSKKMVVNDFILKRKVFHESQ